MSRWLDMTCGSRMFWTNREHPDVVYLDRRVETHQLRDRSSRGGSRTLTIRPMVQADFTALPFRDAHFDGVVFDPPHLVGAGVNGWLAKKYGTLPRQWKWMIRLGFTEGFRVLRPHGTLILKWSVHSVTLREVLSLTPHPPLFGSQHNRQARTHWIIFTKEARR